MPDDAFEERVSQAVDNIDRTRRHGLSIEEAARQLQRMGVAAEIVEEAVDRIRDMGRRKQILKIPGGFENLAYRERSEEAKHLHWYTGPVEGDRIWPAYREQLIERGLEEALGSIDQASDKIVAYLGDPTVHGLQKKGLVLGHIQSGKTANFMAVIAKAADAGYRLIIVLSGLHNALRQQTQRRLNRQLVDPVEAEVWFPLTEEEKDFGHVSKGAGLLAQDELRLLAAVKKNPTRLRRLVGWLDAIPERTRYGCPALIVDDEADQATPNTGPGGWDRSTINELIVKLRSLLPTSTYLAYTATPFANVFIDPTDDESLYPEDFIIDLPKPDGYFGTESIFGRPSLGDGDEPDDGLDMVREVPDDEAARLRPPRPREERESFEPPITGSLDDALRWFLLATAARRVRGQEDQHSSMLVHTTQYSAVHLRHREAIEDHVSVLRRRFVDDEDDALADELAKMWEAESRRVPAAELGEEPLEWEKVRAAVPDVLDEVEVIADNYLSEERLDYTEGPEGRAVVAVGGNTLSRGLTLEGLVVSYFIRSASAYDTLLQMGRWFGYRDGYADLPRVWMTRELASAFRHLATVEAEIRDEIERYEEQQITPRQHALRVRTHPSLLVTSRLKQRHVELVQLSYSGRKLQTFLFRHRDPEWLEANLEATRELIDRFVRTRYEPEHLDDEGGRWLFRDVPVDAVVEFIRMYRFHEAHADLDRDLLTSWILKQVDENGELERWNVAVMGSTRRVYTLSDGEEVELGTVDLGLPEEVLLINRAPMANSREDEADIKALMSKPDRVVDVEGIDRSEARGMSEPQLQKQRPSGKGLLLIYPISKDSVPMGGKRAVGTRKEMNAVNNLIGVGLVFPDTRSGVEADALEQDYVAVRLPDDAEYIEQDDVEADALDTEGSAEITPDDEIVAPAESGEQS